MEVFTIELPAMYADHHVVEVRRILLSLEGVQDVYASSAFHAAEITFDPAQIDEKSITDKLDAAGYIGELPIPVEQPAQRRSDGTMASTLSPYFRRTAAYETTGNTVSFAQNIIHNGRALWPCPGMQPISGMDEE